MYTQTRWGVGFGPRDCSDYNTGISVIPISRLTDADRKWVLTAEFGGTGGLPLEEGMVIEEPDIEIGAGVSSKGKPLAFSVALPLGAQSKVVSLYTDLTLRSHQSTSASGGR